MKKYILALDQGTTSSRAILFDHSQNIVGMVSREFPQIYPAAGWVEHDPVDIWSSVYACIAEVIAGSDKVGFCIRQPRQRRKGKPDLCCCEPPEQEKQGWKTVGW